MSRWKRMADGIDALNGRIGRIVCWLTLAMVLVASYNALARHLGRAAGRALTSNALLELQWYLFSAVFLFGGAYALKCNAHVRVDVIYDRIGRRARAWINLLGAFFFLLPFSVFMLIVCWQPIADSWSIRETSPDPGGLARYPIKALVLVAFVLLILQAIAEVIKQITILREGTPDPAQPSEPERTSAL